MLLGGFSAAPPLQVRQDQSGVSYSLNTNAVDSLEVKELDGSPDYLNIGVLEVDSSTGLSLSQPGTGIALVSNLNASPTQIGVVNLSEQNLGIGHKIIGYGNHLSISDSQGRVGDPDNMGWQACGLAAGGSTYTTQIYHNGTQAGVETLEANYGTHFHHVIQAVGAGVVTYSIIVAAVQYDGGTAVTGGLTFKGGLYISGTVATSTVITVANEGTDTTCFPAFFTAATGDLGPKTNAALTFNSNTANLACTTFTGALVGNADTVTTNANLTGPITSTGNSTAIASQTGTGSTFAMSVAPTFTGVPAAPTAAPGTNTTQIATTAFVAAAVGTPISNTKTNYTGTTTNALVTVFTLTNTNGLHGSFSVKNTHATNGLSYKVTAVDMYGTSRNSGTVPVPVGNVATFCFDTILSTTVAGSPNSSVTLEVIDTSAGSHATYDVYTSVVG